MSFKWCDSFIHSYRTQGYVVFRQILPPSLVRDLRKATARVHTIARAKHGPQAQRLQPFMPELTDAERKAFTDYYNHSPLVDAIARVLTPRHKIGRGDLSTTGLLLEPADLPWCTNWHRDIRIEHDVPDRDEFKRVNLDPLFFNQINCPLYEDNCTWYVPGSYLRDFDLDAEIAAATMNTEPGSYEERARKPGKLHADDATWEERERSGIEYCESMPGAARLSMDAGDFALYHPNGWHLGNYLPDRRRVTIHDFAPTPELLDWYERWSKSRKSANEKRRAEAAKAQAVKA